MRRGLLGFAVISMSACWMNPSVKKLDLANGEYILVTLPWACAGAQNWPSVGTFVMLSHEGSDWVARSRSQSDGSVELRFHEVANSAVAGVAVSGTLSGVGQEGRSGYASSVSVSFARSSGRESAALAAQSTPGVPNSIAGNVIGQVLFTDSRGGVLSCPSGEVGLRLPAPCELDSTVPCQ